MRTRTRRLAVATFISAAALAAPATAFAAQTPQPVDTSSPSVEQMSTWSPEQMQAFMESPAHDAFMSSPAHLAVMESAGGQALMSTPLHEGCMDAGMTAISG